MENGSTGTHSPVTLKPDGSQNRKSPETGGEDALGESSGLSPGNVACRVFGPNPEGSADLEKRRPAIAKAQRQAVVAADLVPVVSFPGKLDAKGTEHAVRFRGRLVEKHQHSDGWMPVFSNSGMLGLERALPIEYLRRLHLQNELFGDDIRIVGLTRADRFAISQPTLRGGEPSENEIRDLLEEAGWQRVPIALQDLPAQLMGSAWWHGDEGLVLLDARKPNFKKTDFGVIPIDLILADLSPEIREQLIHASI
ncbi:MAG: hypothetical protein ABIT37_23180 [Luteolibacter sp.]